MARAGVVTAWLVGSGCGPAAPPPLSGTLLLVSERGDEPERVATVWAMAADGTAPRRIAPELAGAAFPGAPDPRGTHALVVTAEDDPRGHVERLWLAPLDGGTAVPLTPPTQILRNPAWTPDGSAIVLESDAASFRDLYRVPREGRAQPARLTDQPNGSFQPDVSRTGRIALSASRDGNAEIYAMAADGSDPVRLTSDPGDDLLPKFSPDGARIVWIAHRSGTARAWIMAADGANARPVRPGGAGTDLEATWSPDGSRVAVVVQDGPRQGAIRVFAVPDGREVGVLDGPGMDEHPAWSPDGAWIAWTAGDGARSQVRLATPDGAHTRIVSAGAETEWLPRWVGLPTP